MFLENLTHVILGKRETVGKCDLYLLSQSTFRIYNIYLVMCEICDKNTSDKKYEKLRNCLFKMKN